jgi:WD40 repeat protein
MVLLGDPLYRPFGTKPRPSLIARAYLAGNATGVLAKGETSSLLAVVECIGPAGSGTPALSATIEPEMGLAAASGFVSIPALKAGESALIRIPSVTAGADPTGMFRLHINAQDENHQARGIVLEGRIGFSRLTTGLFSKTQMSVSPSGDEVIAGQPGRSMLIQTRTLELKQITPPSGFALTGAEFSPDGAHIALALNDPQQKKAGVILTDSKLGDLQSLPPETRFMRWLGKDQVLLIRADHLVSHSFTGGEDYIFQMPADWSGPLAGGSVIPGTKILFVTSGDGKTAFANGSEPFHEVLRGTRATRFSAIANDLSVFGGTDSRKRLWIQRGVDADPEILAEDVSRVIWGPISRRALVIDESGKGRVYDNRDRSWIDLGSVGAAQWSPDEERLLFVSREGSSENYLSVLINGKVEKLCDFVRIGRLDAASITADGEKVFLLAGIGGQSDVWMTALPARAVAPPK